LDISNMYSNIPTGKIPPLITFLCNQHNVNKKIGGEITKITRTLLQQNYFQFHNIYTHTHTNRRFGHGRAHFISLLRNSSTILF
jgi:hypothetical protein